MSGSSIERSLSTAGPQRWRLRCCSARLRPCRPHVSRVCTWGHCRSRLVRLQRPLAEFACPVATTNTRLSHRNRILFINTGTFLASASSLPRPERVPRAGLQESPHGALLPRRSPERPWLANAQTPMTGFLERRSSQVPENPAGQTGERALHRRHSFSPGALGAWLGFKSGLGSRGGQGSTRGAGDGGAALPVASPLGRDADQGPAQGSTHGSPLQPPGEAGPAGGARLAGALAAARSLAGRSGCSPGQGGTPASASDSGSFCSAWDTASEALGRVSPAAGPAPISSALRDAARPPAGGAAAEAAALRARVAQLEAQLAAAGLPVAPAATCTPESPALELPPNERNVRWS